MWGRGRDRGKALSDGDRVTIENEHEVTGATSKLSPSILSRTLPDWCNVYAGLSDEEIAEIEKIVLRRADLTRPTE